MEKKIQFEFLAKMWQYSGKGAWCFVSLPMDVANEIRENLKWQEEGWGRMKVIAKIGLSEWDTALWFDTKHNTYILPVKAEIRKKENLGINQEMLVVVGL